MRLSFNCQLRILTGSPILDRFLRGRKPRAHPVLQVHSHWIDKLAVFNGVFSGFALFPQLFQVLTSHSTLGVSPMTYGAIFLNNIVWGMYAFHRSLISVLLAAILNILASGVLLLLIIT